MSYTQEQLNKKIGDLQELPVCSACEGTGIIYVPAYEDVDKEVCDWCGGNGYIEEGDLDILKKWNLARNWTKR